jgi:hypothetical protein
MTVRTKRRKRAGVVGVLTPQQLADRIVQLSRQWHNLVREEIAKTGQKDPPSRVDLKRYDAWAKEIGNSPLSILFQGDTLDRFDEWRALYRKHWGRVANLLGKAPQAMSPADFDRHRGGFFGSMPWWGWLIVIGLGAYIIKELTK